MGCGAGRRASRQHTGSPGPLRVLGQLPTGHAHSLAHRHQGPAQSLPALQPGLPGHRPRPWEHRGGRLPLHPRAGARGTVATPVSKELAGSVPGGDAEPHARQRDGLPRPALVRAEFGPGALASNGGLLLITTTAPLSPEPRWPHPALLPPAGPPKKPNPLLFLQQGCSRCPGPRLHPPLPLPPAPGRGRDLSPNLVTAPGFLEAEVGARSPALLHQPAPPSRSPPHAEPCCPSPGPARGP